MSTPDRWPPYEEQVTSSGAITVNAITWSTPTGLNLTFTPSIDCMVTLLIRADVTTAVAVAGSFFQIRGSLLGSPSARLGILSPGTAADRNTVDTFNRFSLSANTTYQVFAECSVSVAGSTFIVNEASINLIVMPRLHAPLS